MNQTYFSRSLFQFLVELRFNNERTWFNANKPRYEQNVRRPMLRFIGALMAPLGKTSPRFLADPRPVGGSMFRIYRDTRFSNDKTPYKPYASAQFRHRDLDKDVHGPGYYLHLEPGDCSLSAGIWLPDTEPLKRIRQAIVNRPLQWKKIRTLPLWGEALKRPPKGFNPEHPYIEDLKRKHFITWVDFTDQEVCGQDFMEKFIKGVRKMEPLMEFVCKAMRLRY
jgi:uncharacterized protein (TIGR02453 family)